MSFQNSESTTFKPQLSQRNSVLEVEGASVGEVFATKHGDLNLIPNTHVKAWHMPVVPALERRWEGDS